MGVQLSGVMLAGVGLAWAGERVVALARSWRPRIRLAPIAAGSHGCGRSAHAPAWFDRATYAANDTTSVALQVDSDQTDGAALDVLINDINARGGGARTRGCPGIGVARTRSVRFPSTSTSLTTASTRWAYVLRTPSIVADNEAYFNQNDPAQYQLYNVRYILMPSGMTPPVRGHTDRVERQAYPLECRHHRLHRGRRHRRRRRSRPQRHGLADAAVPALGTVRVGASWRRSPTTAASPRHRRSRPAHDRTHGCPGRAPMCSSRRRTGTSPER